MSGLQRQQRSADATIERALTPSITAIILTRNEEMHIARCIASIRPVARHILVVDSFSSDRTVEIARENGATVKQNPFRNYATQFAWALSQLEAQTDWIMRIDADEQFDDRLRQAILTKVPKASDDVVGFSVCLREHFFGRPIRFGGRAMHLLRLWRFGRARIEQRWMDEHMVLDSGNVQELDGLLLHSNEKPLTEWIAKHNAYSNREAIDVLNDRYRFFETGGGKPEAKPSRLRALYYSIGGPLAPLLYFVYRYIVRLGFLDGREGYLYHFLQGYWYRTLVATKLLEFERLIHGCETNEQRLALLRRNTGLEL
ncbi:MAG: glycosyltransferase family 2 protein [Pseudorhodoplanes sp.]|uniref:glycosyltransferase family 2 protein n=1 Tax=Pseudorhodoplanes sp. TaxID=1934341 RepID=UPI003D0CAF5F